MIGREVFIVDGVRTPRGKGSAKGALAGVPPLALVGALLDALKTRAPALPDATEDLVLGCATQVDGQGTNVARTAALLSGWDRVPGVTLNRFCASGIDAVSAAAARIASGQIDVAVAGGVESVSRVPMFADRGPLYTDPAVMSQVGTIHMGIAADLAATREGFSREQLDAFAMRTREKARAAVAGGRGAQSIVPVAGLTQDELLSYVPTTEELRALPPAFADLGASGQDAIALACFPDLSRIEHLHTRASSPPLADAAALLVLADRESAARLGLRPRARIVASATAAVDPVEMLTAGQRAAEKVLQRSGLAPRDLDVIEFAEAFSALCLALQRDMELGDDRFNPNGGTMALGHAFGATGAILVLNVVDELERRGGRRGVAAVSGAAGLGVAALIESAA